MILSIGLPTYGRPQFYKTLLESLIADAAPFLNKSVELIVSNDASPDETDAITRKIWEEKPVFRYFLQEKNLGPIGNSAFLTCNSAGKYLWLIGNDDVVRPGTVERVLGYIKKYEEQNLGGIFLATVTSAWLSGTNPIDWDEADRHVRGPKQEILETYDPEKVGRLVFHPDQNGAWMFVSKCILLRSAYEEILTDPAYQKLLAHPLSDALYAVRGRTFIQDHVACIVDKVTLDDSHWDVRHHYVRTVDLLRSILELRRFGFTEPEVRRMVNSLFMTSYYFLELRHCFRRDMWAGGKSLRNWLEMMRLIIGNGYFRLMLSHLPGRYKRTLRRMRLLPKSR